jgi:hypothetical protein
VTFVLDGKTNEVLAAYNNQVNSAASLVGQSKQNTS